MAEITVHMAGGSVPEEPGNRNLLKLIHPMAGALALATIATFWLSTVVSELFASEGTVAAVKAAVPWGFLVLIPALAATGGSGMLLAKGQRKGLVGGKLKRMPFIAANGFLVLIPSALFLAAKSKVGEFDMAFYTVQGIELAAGAVNIALLGLSTRAGLKLTQWRRQSFLRPATSYSTSLVGRNEIARDTMAFHLKKREGFTYTAGQAVYVTLPGLTSADGGGRVRTFSIASAPQDSELVVATRVTNTSFKHGLMSLPLGAPVEIEGPYGDLSLHPDSARPAVFLAGGIGITPFRSMIRDATARALPHRLLLFYANRSIEDAAFLSELIALEKQNPRLKLIVTLTGNETADWHGERGPITREMISSYVGDLSAPVYYLAGPSAMVSATQALLKDTGVAAKDILAEGFVGY